MNEWRSLSIECMIFCSVFCVGIFEVISGIRQNSSVKVKYTCKKRKANAAKNPNR